MAYLLHVDIPEVSTALKVLMGSILAATLVLGIWLVFVEVEGAMVMFAVTVFDALVFRAVLPRRYEIWSESLRIVLGGPFAVNFALRNIAKARAVAGRKAYVYRGVRFATTNRGVIEIVRRKGLNVVISPRDRETFLQRLSQALEAISTAGRIA